MKKNMGVMSAISIVVGCVIGAGVFFKPYAIYQATGGAPGLGLLSWLIGGLISIFGALTFAEIAVMIPRTGGMVTYLGEVYNRKVGFLAGWMQVVIFYPAYVAGYGVKVGTELSSMFGTNVSLPIGILVIAGIVVINVIGSGSAGVFQIVSTVCKLIPLILITLGKDGSRAYYKDIKAEAAPFLQENTIETTGAGDTFCACILNYVLEHGLEDLSKEGLEEMLTFANAAASLITTRKGALRVMPTKQEVLDFIAK